MISSESSTQRRKEVYELWGKHITNYGHEYGFCTSKPIETIYNWIPSKNWGDWKLKFTEDRDRKNKRISMAEYFLKNTNADFYISSTDDIIVDFLRINEFASILNKKYDTNKDLILLGNCQAFPHGGVTFIQGGSGYIMTRRMAIEFVKHSKRWLAEPNQPDDVDIAKFLGYIGLKPANGTVPYMIGHPITEFNVKEFDPSKLQKCGDFYEPLCRQGIHNLRDVYIIHTYINSFEKVLKFWNLFQRMIHDDNHQYGYYNVYPITHVCLLK